MSTEDANERAAFLGATRCVPLCKINKSGRRNDIMKRAFFVENLFKIDWKVDQYHFSCVANIVELVFAFTL